MYLFTMVCPKCNKLGNASQDHRVPEPHVSCGDCLMDHVEVVRMKVVMVAEDEGITLTVFDGCKVKFKGGTDD